MEITYCRVIPSFSDSNKIHIDRIHGTGRNAVERDECWVRFELYIREHAIDFIGKEFIKIVKNLDFYSTNHCKWTNRCNISEYYGRIIRNIDITHDHIVVTIKPKECYISTSTWHQNALTEYFAKKCDALDKGTIDGKTWGYMTRDEWDYITNDLEVTKEANKMKDTPKELQRKHIDGCKRALYKTYITRVIFNDKATILFFTDGSKSVVKCTETDNYSREAGIALAYLKHKIGKESFHYVMNALTGKKGESIESLYRSNIKIVDKTNKEDKNND